MKLILILIANILFLGYTAMFFADHRFWPDEISLKIRNIVLIIFATYICYNILCIYILKKDKPDSGLVYKVAAACKHTFNTAHSYIEPFQKELIKWSLIAAGLIVIGFVLVGMPGALILEIPVKLGISKPIEGDNAWPAALFLSFLWPLLLPVSVIVKHSLIRNGYETYTGFCWSIAFIILGITILSGLVFLMFRK